MFELLFPFFLIVLFILVLTIIWRNNAMELSFWIGAHLGGPVADEQQRLLEERNTHTRLQREYEMLDHTRKQLAARTALKESFPDIKEN